MGEHHRPRARIVARSETPNPPWDERRLTTVQRYLLRWQVELGTIGAVVVITAVMSLLSLVFVTLVIVVVYGWHEYLQSWQYPVFSLLTPMVLAPAFLWQMLKLLEVFVALSTDYRELSERDQLTGLLNRRGLFERCAALVAGTRVVMADLDDFKVVNDDHGHDFGDRVLVAAARRLIAAVGHDCLVARTGGDEFVIVVPPADQRELPAGLDLQVGATPIRISLGVANFVPEAGIDAALIAADDALYDVKGRSRERTTTPGEA